MKKFSLLIILAFAFFFVSACFQDEIIYNETPKTYYVSSMNGDIDNDGLSMRSPLLSISQINELDLKPGDSVLLECGSVFRGNLVPLSGSEEQKITYASYGGGDLPIILGSVNIESVLGEFEELSDNIYGIPCNSDVGNIIINEGEYFGAKKFEVYSLNTPLDYCFDRSTGVLYIYVDEEFQKVLDGEESLYYSVEFCATEHIVDLGDKHDVIIKDIALQNGGAHGISMYHTHNIIIENCRISYIGGGFLHYDEDNNPVRYGNGIELYNSGSNILVADCEIFEIFDTAVTNQGSENNGTQSDIIYRDNVIYNCGMAAFELWLKGKNTTMSDIAFEDNTVYDIGYGFSLTQGRQDNMGLGYFIINFGSDADFSNISIADNTFNGIYNAHGYSSLLLNMDIETSIEDDEIYKSIEDNEVNGNKYRVVYRIDGEVFFLEQAYFPD